MRLLKNTHNNWLDELRKTITENLTYEFISAVLSNPRQKEEASKTYARPLLKKERTGVPVEIFRNNQVFHKNADPRNPPVSALGTWKICADADGDEEICLYGAGKQEGQGNGVYILQRPASVDSSHNRKKKQYILGRGRRYFLRT